MSKHRATQPRRAPRLAPLVSAIAVVALGGSFAFWPPDPAASEGIGPDRGASAAAPSRSPGEARLSPSGRAASLRGVERLVVYGHSMPLGGGASDPGLGYAEVAAEATGLQLLNRAEGRTVAGTAARAMGTFFKADPRDVVVIHTGMNDILRRGDDAAVLGRAAIETMLARSAQAARRVLVLECRPASWDDTPPGRDQQTAYDAWNTMLRRTARAAGSVEVLGTCAGWDAARFIDDGEYHPNDDGHRLIAEELVALLTTPSDVRSG